ncbi:NADPH:quinone oxidoreductase family protein [Pontibacterium sp. N1Y112]|uniref:NADPH:quinone oxidoreductase family protein n=1 Tax=Pontibacterium sinense TaxID=2781979 RepID=A0A8J7FG40_9GAMM|nr:NADPH:quinone oxidoreductase family protein [Pontibacterium sinense]MBE9398931.1 NADPH:quinone oxidoreductase family protein [Pontibacterium sinense]
MSAAVCHQWAGIDGLQIEQLHIPLPQEDEVLVEIKATGLNTTDLLLISGRHQTNRDLALPYVPGIEGSGIVIQCGAKVTQLKPGDRVTGSFPKGALADKAITKANHLFRVPDNIGFIEAAALPVSYFSAHLALHWNGRLESGETLLVLGSSGGIGLSAVQIGKAMGLNVIAGASNDTKLEFVKDKGADRTINYRTEHLKNRVMSLTDGKGVDACFDPIGGDLSLTALSCLDWGGRMLHLGFVGGIQQLPANRLLVKNRASIGCSARYFRLHQPNKYRESAEWILERVARGEILPSIGHCFSMADCKLAFEKLAAGAVLGKVVVTP